MFLKGVINKIIRPSSNIIMHIAVFFDGIDIHRLFDGIEAVAPTNRATIPEEQTEKQACKFFHKKPYGFGNHTSITFHGNQSKKKCVKKLLP